MKRTMRTEEQILGIREAHKAGAKCADLCRKHRVSEGTFYALKAKASGMMLPEAKRLKSLEDENAKLKRLLAEQILDMAMKELLSRNGAARSEARGRRPSEGPSLGTRPGAAALPRRQARPVALKAAARRP